MTENVENLILEHLKRFQTGQDRIERAARKFDLIVGTVPAVILRETLDWARSRQAMLMQTWQELNR